MSMSVEVGCARSLREEGVKYLTRKMKLGDVAVRFVVIYLKMGQLTQLCIFST